MTRNARWLLAAGWLTIAASAAVGAWKIAGLPKVDPWVDTLREHIETQRRISKDPPPAARWRMEPVGQKVYGTPPPIDDYAGTLLPAIVAEPIPLPPRIVEILPFALYNGTVDLVSTTITWSLRDPDAALEPHEKRKRGEVQGFVVERWTGDEEPRPIAEVGPKATSYVDGTTEPCRTYGYRVIVKGTETERRSGRYERGVYYAAVDPVVEVRTPSHHRVRLIGGDRRIAILRVESYNRDQGKWISRILNASPGQGIGTSGWRLDGLRFDKSTLVAEVTDDQGESRELTTKN